MVVMKVGKVLGEIVTMSDNKVFSEEILNWPDLMKTWLWKVNFVTRTGEEPKYNSTEYNEELGDAKQLEELSLRACKIEYNKDTITITFNEFEDSLLIQNWRVFKKVKAVEIPIYNSQLNEIKSSIMENVIFEDFIFELNHEGAGKVQPKLIYKLK